MNIATANVEVTAAIGTTGEFNYGDFEYGRIHVLDGSAATTLTFHTAPAQTAAGSKQAAGDYEAAYDGAGTPAAVTLTVAANRSYPIPTALQGAEFVKAVGDDTASLVITMKG